MTQPLYNLRIGIEARWGTLERARSLMREMQEKGFALDVYTMHGMVEGVSRSVGFKEALLLLLQLCTQMPSVRPDPYIYMALGRALPDRAAEPTIRALLDHMDAHNTVADGSIYAELIRAARHDGACYDTITQHIRQCRQLSDVTIRHVLREFCRAGEWRYCDQIMATLRERQLLSTSAYNCYIKYLIQAGLLDEVRMCRCAVASLR